MKRLMKQPAMDLQTLLSGLLELDESGPVLSGLCLDSRRVQPGHLFVALAGLNGRHGLEFARQALDRGAAAILHDGQASPQLLERLRSATVPVLELPGLGRQLPVLAQRYWGEQIAVLDLVAVTGTNGKTSIAWLLAQALGGAMIGTLGCGRPGEELAGDMTTPDLLTVYAQLAELALGGERHVVLEASSHALDQGRLAGLKFSSVIFTNLGHDHLDYHLDRNAYGAAKARLFTEFNSPRQLINLDDEFGRKLAVRTAPMAGVIGYSLHNAPAARALGRIIHADVQGLRLEVMLGEERFEVRSRLVGQVNAANLLVVSAELAARGVKADEIVERLAALRPVPGRMEALGGDQQPLAIVDYAHTPDALENALLGARSVTVGELWCVFGCGGERDRAKRPLMGHIAERLADQVILTDDNPRGEDPQQIVRAIQSGMTEPARAQVIRPREQAIAHALAHSRLGDVVLIAGKGHETEQIIGLERLPCDDRLSVRRALGVAA